MVKFLNFSIKSITMVGEQMIEEAYKLLYPEREFPYAPKIRYTDQFKEYGANIRLRNNAIEFRLSKS